MSAKNLDTHIFIRHYPVMSIGQRIQQRREIMKISQGELARKIGVSRQRVAYVENTDVDDLKLGMLRLYAEALGTTVEALADGDDA